MKEWVRWLVLDICWIVITVMNIVKGQKSKNVIPWENTSEIERYRC